MSKNLRIFKSYLQNLGITIVRVVRDDHIGLVVQVKPCATDKARRIAERIARDNGSSVEERIQHTGGGSTVFTIPVAGKGEFEWSLGDDGYSTMSVDLIRAQRTVVLPKWKGRATPVHKQLWTPQQKPLLKNWPSTVYHATGISNAVSLLEGGSKGELYFAFTAKLAISYGKSRFPKAALLETLVAKLNPSKIMFDENTGGESFAYYGTLKGTDFVGYAI